MDPSSKPLGEAGCPSAPELNYDYTTAATGTATGVRYASAVGKPDEGANRGAAGGRGVGKNQHQIQHPQAPRSTTGSYRSPRNDGSDAGDFDSPLDESSVNSPGVGRNRRDSVVDGGGGGEVQDDGEPANKRRKTGPGSRSVANLTEEQRLKKRANDREAQRAIRERAKAKLEGLEQRIAELESQHSYQELQATIRQKEAVEAENADIKKVLAAVVNMIQPILNRPSSSVDQAVYPSPGPSYAPQAQPAPPAPQSLNNASTPTSAASPASVGTHGTWQGDMGPSPRHPPPLPSLPVAGPVPASIPVSQAGLLSQQRHDLVHGLEMGAEKLGLEFLLDEAQHVPSIQNGTNGAQDSPRYRHVPMKHDLTVPLNHGPSRGRLVQNLGPSSGSGSPRPVTSDAVNGLATPATNSYSNGNANGHGSDGSKMYSQPIINCSPTCPLDGLLLDFLHERRQRAADGMPTAEIIGPRYPSVSSLLNPAISRFSHPLSKVFTDILSTFPDISRLPERVAVLYVMFLIMRWQISPTSSNHARLPPWVVPGPLQLTRPHPAWIDHIPFTAMRNKLVAEKGPGEFPFENFFIPYTTTLSLNWPYEDTDVLLQNPEGDELMINPVFERHLRRLENWTLGDAFDKAFPALRGTYNLRRDDGSVVRMVSV